ncbi:PhnD/SsuA/transferrin family substrate-binding protein [Thioalkalivibrio sp. ARh3]|uniref:substrate-binding domain-containing protein n=1 Tax=Thioalkalivibrio sp. ARh3 TaxID=1158148 RepID=UPI0003659A7C|nr:PhnD/SsuA/transferrin family substrate-binding protein [Thioalkalivibrio sp. ARh3]
MNRRQFLRNAAMVSMAPGMLRAREARDSVRIGLTPVFLDDQTFLNRWQAYLEETLERPVVFVQRGTYREITELVLNGRVDFAWLCGYPFVRYRDQLEILLAPVYGGRPLYRSYLIASAQDDWTNDLEDLRGRVFAYSDPLSNSGWLVTQAQLLEAGHDPDVFFRRTFFAGAHRNVVEAVAVGLAQGGAVDGYVYDALARLHPDLTAGTRVVWRSETFGFPPMVAYPEVDRELRAEFKATLKGMTESETGQELLDQFYLDGFREPEDGLYAGIERLKRRVEGA